MAAEAGIQPSVYLEHQLSHDHPTKKKTPPLIEKLRHKLSQSRSWKNSINNVRSSVAERRTQTDVPDSTQVKTCMDTMQKAIKVLSLKERLDLIGRQLGLNIDIQDKRISLGTDAFHVDVRLNDAGNATDVKLANQGDVVDCPDLRDVLKNRNFDEFIEHLQGLQSIYQVTNDENLKSKAFLALQSLEKDLNQLAQFQSSISGVANYIHKCPLGVMLPRLAGKPMKLIYFVSPYDLLDKKSLTAHPLTVEAITENSLGQSANVCIEPVGESCPPNKLQTMPLMNVGKTSDGKSLPSFSGWSTMNSMMLPASFVLVLPQSIAMSTHILQKITSLTNLEVHQDSECKNLLLLILESFGKGKQGEPVTNKLFVSLPDQHHMYILNCENGGSQDQQGVMVSRIPFTHPTHVPKILIHIRQQLLFNIILGSCVRPGANSEGSSIIFEVTSVSLQQLTIVFEHPAYDSMITVDIDLSDITNLKCRVSCTNPDQFIYSDEAVSRMFQRCMSIPIMLRFLISKGRHQLDKLKEAALAAEKERREKAILLKEMLQRQAKMQSAMLPTKGRPPPQPPHPPPLPPPPSYPHPHPSSPHIGKGQTGNNGQAHMMSPLMSESRNFPCIDDIQGMDKPNSSHLNDLLLSPDSERVFKPLLTTLLDVEKANDSGDVNPSPMLSRLLDDNTSVATNVIPMNCKPNPPSHAPRRQRKRKSQAEFCGPNPKHRLSETDSLGGSMDTDFGQIIPEQSLNPAMGINMPGMATMSASHGPAPHHPMLNHSTSSSHAPGDVIDLTEEPSLKKLSDSVEKQFIRMDVKTEQDMSMLRGDNDHNQGRIPTILQNSPSGSKNENASTSLEGYLKGSGEVGRAKDFDPCDAANVPSGGCSHSKLSSLLLAPSDGATSVMGKPMQMNSGFLSDKSGSGIKTSVHHMLMTDMRSQSSGVLQHSSNVELFNDKQMVSGGIFEKFDRTRQQQPVVKSEVTENESNMVPSGGAKVSLKLRVPVGPLKQQNSVKTESDLPFSKHDNIAMFEFKSDEDDDDEPIIPRYVCSPSPPSFQLSSNKQKRSSESGVAVKVEKNKKKDKSSGNSAKRKRDKEESKREKKRKKNEQYLNESVYRTVENDEKADFKLKIRVAKKPILEKNDKSEFSDMSQHSYEITKKPPQSPNECKVIPNKLITKDNALSTIELVKEKDNSDNSPTGAIGSGKPMPGLKVLKAGPGSKVASGNLVSSKTDPKLVTKATIRLKPVTIPNSGSSVNVSQSGPKGTVGTAQPGTAKLERRSSSSTLPVDKRTAALNSLVERRGSSSGSLERRSSLQSSTSSSSCSSPAATPVTTSATNIALSSILPNAPTVSKVASMPRIPKLSSSSNTSINRTSSLDPATGTSLTPTGTKSNNSYTMGPGGRHNSSIPPGPGPGGGRMPLNPPSYNSRMAPPPGSWGHRSSLPFNSNRPMGPAHRQSSPVGNSGVRQSGPGNIHRPLISSLSSSRVNNSSNNSGSSNSNITSSGNIPLGGNGSKMGQISQGSNKSSSGFTNNPALKTNNGSSNFNHNANASSQKQFGAGGRMNSIPKSNMVNTLPGGKSSQNQNNIVAGQRYIGSNAHSAGSVVRSSSTKSPNTSGINRSPNSNRSPNISGSNRSPSLNSASKSPNISGSGKSPNVSSTNRSPSLTSSSWSPSMSNPNRSPSIATTSSRSSVSVSSSSSSGKSSGSIKNTLNVMKSALIHKNPVSSSMAKSQSSVMLSSSPFQKHPSSTSSSITPVMSKPSILKNSTSKITDELSSIVSVNSLQQSSASLISTSTSLKISTSSSNSGMSINKKHLEESDISTPCPSFQTFNRSLPSSVISTAQTVSVAPSVSQNLHVPNCLSEAKSSVESPTASQKYNNGSKASPALTIQLPTSLAERFPSSSSTPTTPLSADTKSKVSSPASRGHKKSVSAIVEKLFLNASRSVDSTTMADVHFGSNNLESLDRQNDAAFDDVFEKAIDSKKFSDGSYENVKLDFSASGNKLNSPLNAANKINSERNQEWPKSISTLNENKNDLDSVLKSTQEINISKSKSIDSVAPSVMGVDTTTEDKSFTSMNRPKPLTLSSSSLASPNNSPRSSKSFSSSPFPFLQSPVASGRVPSPLTTTAMSKSINDSSLLSQCNDTVFKIPSIKSSGDQEVPSPELRNGIESNKASKASGLCNEEALHSSSFLPGADIENKRSSSSKPITSPFSDVSSPENDLVIDDESLKGLGKSDLSDSNNGTTFSNSNPRYPIMSSTKSDKHGSNISLVSVVIPTNVANSLQTGRDSATPSPKTSRPPSSASTKSPSHSKTQSGASTPKGSDSPFDIDDELMDVALGCDS